LFYTPSNKQAATPEKAASSPKSAPPEPANKYRYYVVSNNAAAGPYPFDTLKSMVPLGQLTPATLVWRDGFAAWQAAGSLPELASLFPAAPAAPPPPPR
jgi:hypothetical protein